MCIEVSGVASCRKGRLVRRVHFVGKALIKRDFSTRRFIKPESITGVISNKPCTRRIYNLLRIIVASYIVLHLYVVYVAARVYSFVTTTGYFFSDNNKI